MSSLIKFELKKIVSRRVFQVSFGVIFVLFCAVLWFNGTTPYALIPDKVGEEIEGAAAIEQIKANADALAGPVTDEKATEVLREAKAFIDDDGEVKEEYRADRSTPGVDAAEYWRFNATHSAYLGLITRPYMNGLEMPVSTAATIDTTDTIDLYGQVRTKIASQLSDTSGAFTYTDAERDFWMAKAEGVSTPAEYGYKGGWENFLDMVQFLIFAILAVAIACASVYNIEYREKTDAVLLSTKYGKSRLGRAKVISSIIVASAVYWAMALVLLVASLAVFGAEGGALPMQALKLANTYSLSLSAACLICCLIGYAATLGLLGITLALSARMKSSMGILAAAVAIVLVPSFVPNLHNNIANHIVFLFPYQSLNPHNLFDMVSYSIGPLVIEFPIMLTILYLALFAGGCLLASRSFSRRQVA